MDSRPGDKRQWTEKDLQVNRRAVLKLMLSILLWQTPADAGFPIFTDGRIFLLPHNVIRGAYFQVVVVEVLFYALSIRGRSTIVYRLKLWNKDDPLLEDSTLWPNRMVTHVKSAALSGSFAPTDEAGSDVGKLQR